MLLVLFLSRLSRLRSTVSSEIRCALRLRYVD
jgi:hypothetical protein